MKPTTPSLFHPDGSCRVKEGGSGREVRAKRACSLAALLLLAGCGGQPEDVGQPPKPEAVSFGGKIDPRFIGKWTSTDHNSTVEMQKDGTANMVTITRSPYGKVVDKVSGKWLTHDGELLFSYSDKKHDLVVVKYPASVSGKSMTLTQAGGRIKTKYQRS